MSDFVVGAVLIVLGLYLGTFLEWRKQTKKK